MANHFTVLGIETGCDDTAVALVHSNGPTQARIIAAHTLTQYQHAVYGGVVPEIAARAHLDALPPVLQALLAQHLQRVDAVAVTTGPGLIGGLIAGVSLAKGLATAWQVPLLAVNHLTAHALSVRIENDVAYPYLMLLTSGGHCQLLVVHAHDTLELLGTTRDDAPGEAFDKVAKLMGLPYPGGAALEALAKQGNAARFAFPRPNFGANSGDFSFSGLKTAVLRQWQALPQPVSQIDKADIAASFQAAVADCLVARTRYAMGVFCAQYPQAARVLGTAGGVASNQTIRAQLQALCAREGFAFVAPQPTLCTDNGAMIAYVGLEQLRNGATGSVHCAPYAR